MGRLGLIWGGCIAFIIALPGISYAAGKSAAPLIVQVGKPVEGKINGTDVLFKLMPDVGGYPVLNPDTAERLKLDGSLPTSFEAKMGPVRVPGKISTAQFDLAGGRFEKKVVWFERPVAPDADGRLGPDSVPRSIIIFSLRAPDAREKQTSLPLIDQDNGLGVAMTVGGKSIFVRFSPDLPYSRSTAAAGKLIADSLGGQLIGPAREMQIVLGVTRPVRDIKLSKPLTIGPLAINGFAARIWDGGSLSGVADADIDANEIVVTGAQSKIKPRYFLNLGSDALQACSSLTFDKARKIITLSCL